MTEQYNKRLNQLKIKVSEGTNLTPDELKEIFLIMLHSEELNSDNQ